MRSVALRSNDERRTLFRNTADKLGLPDEIVEKDFWVCLTLDYLFTDSPWKDNITFKGGTSLSKAYNLINRFSEDIDLILDWRLLGYTLNEPWEARSNTKQDLFNKEANVRAEEYIGNTMCPKIKTDLSNILQCEADVYVDSDNRQTVIFAYPNLFENTSTLKVIRLEIGALAAWTPARRIDISSFAADCYSDVFDKTSTSVLTVLPERTFWEKATILHHEANRPDHLNMPARYSRHYYDLFRMADSEVKDAAFAKIDLLNKVVEFKKKFYPRRWANYDEAKPGSLRLVPPAFRMAALEEDYQNMRYMLYGDIPSLEQIMERLASLENEINSL